MGSVPNTRRKNIRNGGQLVPAGGPSRPAWRRERGGKPWPWQNLTSRSCGSPRPINTRWRIDQDERHLATFGSPPPAMRLTQTTPLLSLRPCTWLSMVLPPRYHWVWDYVRNNPHTPMNGQWYSWYLRGQATNKLCNINVVHKNTIVHAKWQRFSTAA